MKKILCLALCMIFCISILAGCGLDEEEKGANVRMYLSNFPQSLDPAVIQLNSDVEMVLSLVFESLTTIDEDGKVQPALATEWYYKYDEIYQLHKMYFKLKETKWSDNRAVSADDVIYAWRRILDPETDSPYAALLYPIKGARALKSGVGTIDDLGLAAVDDTLLEITFDVEYDVDLFAETVANIHLCPEREDIVTRCQKDGEDWAGSAGNIVCNGKFKIQSMDMPREKKEDEENYVDKFACKLVLERNAYYLREDDDDALDKYVDPYRITCYYMEGQAKYYPEETGITQGQFQANRYLAGESYFMGAFDKQTYSYFNGKKDIESKRTLNGFAFLYNTQNDILKDANVRKALSVAIDRTALAEVAGTGEVPATGYVPSGVFDDSRKTDFRKVGGELYNVKADEAKAKELLGGKKGTLTVTYLIPQNDYTVKTNKKNVNYDNVYENVAKAAGEYWSKLGFKIEYRGLDPEAYTAAVIARDFDILAYNVIVGSTDAFAYLAPYCKQLSGTSVVVDNSVATLEEEFNTHYTGIDDAKYNELIVSIINECDRKERASKLHEAEKMLVDELCPATMVYFYTRNYVSSKKISGFDDDNWFGYIDFSGLELKNWRKVNASEDAVSEARNED